MEEFGSLVDNFLFLSMGSEVLEMSYGLVISSAAFLNGRYIVYGDKVYNT